MVGDPLLTPRLGPLASPHEFRDAMRNLVGAVSVITAGAGPMRNGLTATSLSSFSVDPASVITSISLGASAWPLIRREGVFSVQVLAADQREIAENFSGSTGLKGVERYRGGNWTTFASGTPRLRQALVSLDCEVDDVVERHTHALVIGLVREASVNEAAALAYIRGSFTGVANPI